MNEHRDRLIDMLLEEELGGAAPPDLTERVLARAEASRRRRLPLPWLVAAAAAILALLGVAQLWLWPAYPEPRASGSYEVVGGGPVGRGAILRTQGQAATLELGGYGRVEMKPGSVVRIDGAPHEEAIYLESGEVVCDVAAGRGSFVVSGPGGSVRVVGTRFTVLVPKEGDGFMVRSMIVRVTAGVVLLLAGGVSTELAAGQEKKAEERGGTVVGVVVAKGENFLEVKADGELKARRYVPNWVGGAPAQGGGPDKKMLAQIGKIPVKARVRLEWKFEERPRVIKVEVIKAEEKK